MKALDGKRVTNSASYKSRKSTSKSSQIIPVFIRITRVLYTQERSRWLTTSETDITSSQSFRSFVKRIATVLSGCSHFAMLLVFWLRLCFFFCFLTFWIVARSMKSVKHRKLCCYCPIPKKDLALLRSTTPTYRTSWGCPSRALELSSSRRWTKHTWEDSEWLSAGSFSVVHPDPCSHYVSLVPFLLSTCTWLRHCWLLDRVCENVARAACTLWSRGSWLGGSLGFRVVPLLLHGSQITDGICGFVVPLLFSFAIPIPEVIQCYHLILCVSDACESISWHRPCWLFVLFFGAWVFGVLFSLVFGVCLLVCTVTAQWIVYRSYSVLFHWHIVVMIDVATALIRWICKMQLSFRLDKRPGESHLALDGKKTWTSLNLS